MREAVIRFVEDNINIHSLDGNRYYFLTEADDVLDKVKENIQQNQWSYTKKKYDFYLNGIYLMQGTYFFDKDELLSEQILTVISNNKKIEKKKKNKILTQIEDSIYEEERLFSNRELQYFCFSITNIMAERKVFLFSLKQLEKLFLSIQSKLKESIFSRMEDIKKAISKSFDLLISYEDLWHGDFKEIHQRLERWFAFNDHFNQYCHLFVSFFFSVPESRLNFLLRKSKAYKKLEFYLFELCAKNNFYRSMINQKKFEIDLRRRRTEVLMGGISLVNDEILQNKVIDYTIYQFFVHEIQQDSLTSYAREFCHAYLNPEGNQVYE